MCWSVDALECRWVDVLKILDCKRVGGDKTL